MEENEADYSSHDSDKNQLNLLSRPVRQHDGKILSEEKHNTELVIDQFIPTSTKRRLR